MLKCGAMEVADAILNGDYGRPTNTHVDVIKGYENRMIPLFSEPQRELVEYLMNTDGCMVDDLIKEICTKENKNVDFESLKSIYYGRQEQ